MHIFLRPPADEVRRLLDDAHLPTADLQDARFEHFLGCGSRDALQGAVGLEVYGRVALLRSLVVAPGCRGTGIGKALVDAVERRAEALGVDELYLLTTTAAPFFVRLGYEETARDTAPSPIQLTQEFSGLCPASSTFMRKVLTHLPGPSGR